MRRAKPKSRIHTAKKMPWRAVGKDRFPSVPDGHDWKIVTKEFDTDVSESTAAVAVRISFANHGGEGCEFLMGVGFHRDL